MESPSGGGGGGGVWHIMHLASTVPGGGVEVMLTEATEDYRKAE